VISSGERETGRERARKREGEREGERERNRGREKNLDPGKRDAHVIKISSGRRDLNRDKCRAPNILLGSVPGKEKKRAGESTRTSERASERASERTRERERERTTERGRKERERDLDPGKCGAHVIGISSGKNLTVQHRFSGCCCGLCV